MATALDPCADMTMAMPMTNFRERPARPILVSRTPSDWREGLPTLAGSLCTMREVTLTDAPSLYAHLCTEDVARFIPPPPSSVAAFEDYVRWAQLRRAQGHHACFGIVPNGHDAAVGVIQVHVPDGNSPVAEWGFAIGRDFWGTGIFPACAERVQRFVFERMGVRRLEARSVVENGRANAALRKMGATRARILKSAFEKRGVRFDQAVWIMTDTGS